MGLENGRCGPLERAADRFSLLYLAFLLTVLGTFGLGQALLMQGEVFYQTLPVGLVCLALCCCLYACSMLLPGLAWGLLATYCLMLGVTYGWRPLFITIFVALSLWGFARLLTRLRLGFSQTFAAVLMGLTAAVVILDCDFSSFDMIQRLHADALHRDTPFHVSIAAMIKNYGVASTGLHGLVPVPYHVFSHELMAAVSVLSGAPVLVVYGVAHWVFFVPVLILAITALVAADERVGGDQLPLIWGLICVFFALSSWLFGIKPFISESYVLALGLFMLGLKVALKPEFGRCDVFLLAGLAAAIAHAKASVGLVFVILFGARALRLTGLRASTDWAVFALGVVLSATIVFASYTAFAQTHDGRGVCLEPFSHIRRWAYWGEQIIRMPGNTKGVEDVNLRSIILSVLALVSFYGKQFFFSWWALGRIVWQGGLRGLWDSLLGLYITTTTVIGVAVVSLFGLPDITAYFFFNVAFYVALPFVVLDCACGFVGRSDSALRGTQTLWAGRTVSTTALMAVLLGAWPLDFYRWRETPGVSSKNTQLIERLDEVRQAAPINVAWRFRDGVGNESVLQDCISGPFFYPAVSERPWIGVISTEQGCDYHDYFYSLYGVKGVRSRVTVEPVLEKDMKVSDFLR